MSPTPSEQRNLYKGFPERAWVAVHLMLVDDGTRQVQLLADTGCPCALVVGKDVMRGLKRTEGSDLDTNFGHLQGNWIRVRIPEIGYDEVALAYASDEVMRAARSSHADFDGLIGLPLLRKMDYGGNPGCFWIRAANDPSTIH